MHRTSMLFLLIAWTAVTLRAEGSIRQVTVPFYSEELTVRYASDFLPDQQPEISDPQLVAFYRQLNSRPYQVLLSDLLAKQTHLQLNDWLFYELLVQSIDHILADHPPLTRKLACWFLLSEAGFDTRLAYRSNQIFLYVYSEDEIYEVPMIEDLGRRFVNLSSIRQPEETRQALFLLNFTPNPGGRPFGFYLASLPRLRPRLHNRQLEFRYGEARYQLELTIDQTIAELMRNYPFISEKQYLEAPLSPTLAGSLLPKLRRFLNDKSQQEAVEFLVSFTRSSFQYREDKEYFGHSKPMIADEVFYYPYSDCEDRSALFYCLVRELLDLPMIIVAFPDHLTVGVALSQPIGAPIRFQDRDYYICDPTGPVNSSEIGRFPQGYEHQPFQIIGYYK